MEILVIGSTSVIGSAIVTGLAPLGSVATAGRRDADVTFDLSVTDPLPDLDRAFDTVVLVAADFGGPSDEDLMRATRINVLGSLASARLAAAAQAQHFVLISSLSAAYGRGDPYFNAYALTKSQSEESVAFYCAERGISLSIVRPTGVFDSAGRCRVHQPLFYAMVDCARSGSDFVIAGSVDPLRNYVHVADVAGLVARLVARREVGTIVCAQPASLPISQIMESAYSVFGNGGSVRFDPSKPDIAELPPIDESTAGVSWSPAISIEDGFRSIRAYVERTP